MYQTKTLFSHYCKTSDCVIIWVFSVNLAGTTGPLGYETVKKKVGTTAHHVTRLLSNTDNLNNTNEQIMIDIVQSLKVMRGRNTDESNQSPNQSFFWVTVQVNLLTKSFTKMEVVYEMNPCTCFDVNTCTSCG